MKLIRVLPEAETSDIIEAFIGLSRLSAAELARRAGVAEGQVSKWRRGLVEPTVPLLLRLATAAGFQLTFAPEEDEPARACTEETRSWDHFTQEQTDSYWIRCTLSGPHDEHKDEHTGLTWRSEARP